MLEDAEMLFENGRYASTTNRAYYANFNAMRAVLALDGVEFKKHSGNIQYFLKNYVKTGVFDLDASEMAIASSKARNDSDYDDFYTTERGDAELQLANARAFVGKVTDYLESLSEAGGREE